MKKWMSLFLVMVFSMSIIAGCGGGAATDTKTDAKKEDTAAVQPWEATKEGDGSWDRVKQAGKITAGLDDAYPPMGYRDVNTNDIIGFDVDMAKAISERIGVPFEFVPADWNAIVPSLKTSKFDVVISGMNMWDERVAEINFVPYGIADQVVLVKKDAAEPDKMSNLDYFKEKKIGTQLGSTGAKMLTEAGFSEGKNMTLYKTFPEITVDLDNGRIDALAIDSFGATELLATGNYELVTKLTGAADDEHGKSAAMIGIGIRKTDGDLQRVLQDAVDELIADGTLKEISMKWIGSDITEGLVDDAKARVEKKAAA